MPRRTAKTLIIDGVGAWTLKSYRPAILRLAEDPDFKEMVNVWYVDGGPKAQQPPPDDSEWEPEDPPWEDPEWGGEARLVRSDDEPDGIFEFFTPISHDRWKNLPNTDAIFVVTPDFAHVQSILGYLDHPNVVRRATHIYVEKPFSDSAKKARVLRRRLEADGLEPPIIRGIDHYTFHLSDALRMSGDESFLEFFRNCLDSRIDSLEFFMLEAGPIEKDRLKTLKNGLTSDLASHFLGMFAPFAEPESIDNVEVQCVGQHTEMPGPFEAETCSALRFNVRLREAYGGESISCLCVVGKGIGCDAKFLDIHSGNRMIRIDLTRNSDPLSTSSAGAPYPFRSVIKFLDEPDTLATMPDPYREYISVPDAGCGERTFMKESPTMLSVQNDEPLAVMPYRDLIRHVCLGDNGGPMTLTHEEAEGVVDGLDLLLPPVKDTGTQLVNDRRNRLQSLREEYGEYLGGPFGDTPQLWPLYEPGTPPDALMGNGLRVFPWPTDVARRPAS